MTSAHSISRKSSAGAAWMLLFKAVDASIGILSTLILARLLAPGDFGIVAMATSVIALLALFSAFGLDTVLIQRSDATPDHFNAAWSLNLLAGGLVGAALLLLAWPAAILYHEPRLVAVMCILASSPVIQGLENIGTVAFRKELEFDREFRYLTAKRVIPFFITVPLALWLRSYWALVIGTVVGRIVATLLSYRLHPYRPRFSLSHAGELMHFSKWLVLHNLIAFFKDRSASFVIGRYADTAALGIFTLSEEIATTPSTGLIAPINRALLPVYSKLAGDMQALAREYLGAMGIIALIGVPAVAGVAATSPFIVLLLLGAKWGQAIPVLDILAFFGITQVVQTNAFAAFLALRKPEVYVQVGTIHVIVQIALLIALTAKYGILGSAWAYAITALVLLPLNFAFITYYLKLRPLEFLGRLWRPMISAAAMYGVVRMWGPAPPTGPHLTLEAGIRLAGAVSLGVTSYAACIGLLWLISGMPEGAELTVARQVGSFIARVRSRTVVGREQM